MDLNEIMKQAQAMQKQLEQANQQLAVKEFEGSASNGLVKVTCNGEYEVVKVDIDESIINKEDKEMIEDLFMLAVNDAINKVNNCKQEKFGGLASSLGIK